jgi:hypothetical protein
MSRDEQEQTVQEEATKDLDPAGRVTVSDQQRDHEDQADRQPDLELPEEAAEEVKGGDRNRFATKGQQASLLL